MRKERKQWKQSHQTVPENILPFLLKEKKKEKKAHHFQLKDNTTFFFKKNKGNQKCTCQIKSRLNQLSHEKGPHVFQVAPEAKTKNAEWKLEGTIVSDGKDLSFRNSNSSKIQCSALRSMAFPATCLDPLEVSQRASQFNLSFDSQPHTHC